MNCLQCRHALTVSPRRRSAELAAHLRICSACARHAAEQARLERALEGALRLPAPEHLAERVRLEASLRRPRPWRRLLAMAAVVAACITLALGGWEYRSSRGLTEAIAAQVSPTRGQSEALTDPRLVARAAAFRRFLQDAGLGHIAATRQSLIEGRPAALLTVVNDRGSAQVFLLPDARLSLEHDIDVGGTPGKLIPAAGGTIAVLCPDRRMLARVTKRLASGALASG